MPSQPGDAPRQAVSERMLVFLIGAVQFINILDFVMVMPLGPDFAKALAIPTSKLGFIGGAYTAAAAVSGLAGSLFLDRFDRRSALAVAMTGLVCGTAMGGFATGLPTLLAARVVAGMFGGPATSLALSIVADAVPAERRGKALGAVMGAFSVASVVGVPAGLELARWGSWRLPFFATASLGVLITTGVLAFLPAMRGHLAAREAGETRPTLADLLGRSTVLLSYTMTAIVMMSGFILIPNISTYAQENLHFPRSQLSSLYFAGGILSFFSTRLGGYCVDRWGSFRTGLGGALLLLPVQYAWFVDYSPRVPMIVLFMSFMTAMGFRNVAYNTLTSKVPSPRERARFMSLQSAVQHASSAAGAFLSAQLLVELPDHSLAGVERLAYVAMALTAIVPAMLFAVERTITRPAG